MKTLLEKGLGDDGAKVGLYVSGGMLEAKASVPVALVVEKVTKPLDPLKEKLKSLIPGDWENPLVDKLFIEAKEEMTKLLSE